MGETKTVRMLLIVDDPESVLARAVAEGAMPISPVGDEHGWRLGWIDDPFGHRWEIDKPISDWPPAQDPCIARLPRAPSSCRKGIRLRRSAPAVARTWASQVMSARCSLR